MVIIAAARSGTKIVRDALAEATGAGKVPYDIGYVWRVRNETQADDVLEPFDVDDRGREFIRRFIDRYAAGNPPAVVEKTVANALRVPMVASVLPDARYVHLIRDGVDVAESTRRQWLEPADWRYLLAKARHFPPRLALRYGTKYATSLATQVIRRDHRIGSWGPRYPGIDDDLEDVELIRVCARQWRHAIERAQAAFADLDVPVCEVRYDALLEDPAGQLARMATFAGLPCPNDGLRQAVALIRPARVGNGRLILTNAELVAIDTEIGDLQQRLGYERAVVGGR